MVNFYALLGSAIQKVNHLLTVLCQCLVFGEYIFVEYGYRSQTNG